MSKRDDKIQKVYEYIESYSADNGFPPSVREICTACGVKSTASVYDYIEILIANGMLTKAESKKRSLNPIKKCSYRAVPLVGKITAGSPILAVENIEGYYPLPDEYGSEVFMLKVEGTSMIDAGINNGDLIIVKKQSTAENGDIVAALFEDRATVKRFFKTENAIILHPENSQLQDIILHDIIILGKVVGLIRKI